MSDERAFNEPSAQRTTNPAAGAEDRLLAFADRLRRAGEDEEKQIERPEVWVSFHLAHGHYALPVTHVREYAPVGKITRVPGAPPIVLGVSSLRGHTIPIVDLKQVLGLSAGSVEDADHVLVAEQQGRLIGLLIDRIDQIVKIMPSKIKSASALGKDSEVGRIMGFYDADGASLILLAADTFLSQEAASSS